VLRLSQLAFITPASSASPDQATSTAGATATVVDQNTLTSEVKIPRLGVDVTVPFAVDTGAPTFTKLANGQWFAVQRDRDSFSTLWQWMVLGNWVLQTPTPVAGQAIRPDYVGVFVTGAATVPTDLPTTGSAIYNGGGPSVTGYTFVQAADPYFFRSGDANFTVNFATGTMTGALTNITFSNVGGPAWMNVGLTGSLSGSALSGTAAVTYTSNASLMAANATGMFTGGLYGPGFTSVAHDLENELGVAWSVSDGVHTTIGTAGAQTLQGATDYPVRTFSGDQPIIGTVFPLTQAAYQVSGANLTTDAAASANSTATLVGLSTTRGMLDQQVFELKVPALGIDARLGGTLIDSLPLAATADTVQLSNGSWLTLERGTTASAQYLLLGEWMVSASNPGAGQPLNPTEYGTFITGSATPVSSMPTSGTATYSDSGPLSFVAPGPVVGVVSSPGSSGNLLTLGQASSVNIVADFGTAKLSGTLTSGIMQVNNSTPVGTIGVSLNGSISSNTFSGATSVTSSTGGLISVGASGTFQGGFFGPNLQEIGGLWNVSDGTNKIVGGFGAPKMGP
jgi:hypothetical protein